MANLNHDSISILNDLIETCRDGEKGFRSASDSIKDPKLQQLFLTFSEQRRKFILELQDEVRRLGGDPDQAGSVSGALHRGWLNLKSAITGNDDAAIISECERGEDAAVRAYRDALSKILPADCKRVVTLQAEEIQDAHDRIRGLELVHKK